MHFFFKLLSWDKENIIKQYIWSQSFVSIHLQRNTLSRVYYGLYFSIFCGTACVSLSHFKGIPWLRRHWPILKISLFNPRKKWEWKNPDIHSTSTCGLQNMFTPLILSSSVPLPLPLPKRPAGGWRHTETRDPVKPILMIS